MPGMARIIVGILLMVFTGWLVLLPADAGAPAGENSIELKAVKYADLGNAVRAQRGKVVVIDVWANFCIPCKREFHNLVELHRQYADKGLVCMSVSLDQPERKDAALKFLKKANAAFSNFWLDEKATVWQERWKITGPPAVFVFDRQGKRAGKFDSENEDKPWSYEDVKTLIQKLLAQSS
ncbi:MAG TPA: TlpA disulfide reductase family protein [Gemmataceae bacterium]|nr:TlpA disulfide reductase family protein [Gemmataceae bacterium]